MRRFEPGEVIVQRHIMFGAPVVGWPLTVVSDSGDVLASYLQVGTTTFGIQFADRNNALEEVASGQITFGEKTWVDNNALILVRPDDPYCVMGFWHESGPFVCWYINLQDPMRRTPIGWDSRDHALDLIYGEDLKSYMWKDEAELEGAVELGLYTAEEAAEFRRNGEAVIESVERNGAWWKDWRDFTPDADWPVPTFPDGWNVTDQ